MKNTIEQKQRYFVQYWGQKVLCFKGDELSHKYMMVNTSIVSLGLPQQYLELTPLDQITDEHAIEWYENHCPKHQRKAPKDQLKEWNGNNFDKMYPAMCKNLFHYCFKDELTIETIDFVRKHSYALPFMGVSVETLISWGWLKIKTK